MRVNPITARELKARFRSGRSAFFVSLWLLLVAVFGYLFFLYARLIATQNFGFGFDGGLGGGALVAAQMGRTLFEVLVLFLVTTVLLIVPGVAALAIVTEKERLTFELLQVSQLRPWQVITGKLGSALAYLLLLIVAAAPLLVLPTLIGGVTVGQVLRGLLMVLVVVITLGSISIWISSRAKTVRSAVATSYMVALFIGFASIGLIGFEIWAFAPSSTNVFPPEGRELYSMWVNPYSAVVSAIDEPLDLGDGAPQLRGGFQAFQAFELFFLSFQEPFSPIQELLIRRNEAPENFFFDGPVFFEEGFGGGIAPQQGGFQDVEYRRGYLWIRSLVVYALISALSLAAAARRISAPRALALRDVRRNGNGGRPVVAAPEDIVVTAAAPVPLEPPPEVPDAPT